MRITGIELGSHMSIAAEGTAADCELYIFHSPAIVRYNGSEYSAEDNTALILKSGQERAFRPADGMSAFRSGACFRF